MKTLKQILPKYAFHEYDSNDQTDEVHQMFYIDDVLKSVNEFLEQNGNELWEIFIKDGWLKMYAKLMEEVKA